MNSLGNEKEFKPPRLADRFLHWFCKPALVETIQGDLYEQYQIERARSGKFKSNLNYFIHIINFLRPFAIKRTGQNSNQSIMLKHYFTFAFRNLRKHKQDTSLNLLSLTIGIACFLFIFIYVKDELGYDKFHRNYQDIYRITIDFIDNNGTRIPDATTPPALAPALLNEFPDIAEAARVFPMWGGSYLLGTSDNKKFKEKNILRVDPAFLQVFSFNLVEGDANSALSDKNNIIISSSMAKKYFGDNPALGESIISYGSEDREFIVTGIMADVPYNSHFTFDFLMPITFNEIDENWGWYNFYTYVRLKEKTSISSIEPKLQPLYNTHADLDEGETPNIIYSQPLANIHLKSNLKWELGTNGDINNIYFFIALGIFVLIISFINYLNLTVAQAFKRAKEVGIRKVFGAQKNSIIAQLVVESTLVILVSLVLGTLLTELLFANFESLIGKSLSVFQPLHINFYLLMCGATLFLGVIAGLLPALTMSSFNIANVVKGILNKTGKSALGMRKSLLIVQFTISAIMIIGTMTVYKQLQHFRNTDMGFSKDQVLIVPNNSSSNNKQNFKTAALQLPGVTSVGLSSGVVGGLNWTFTAGYPNPVLLNYSIIDPDYIEAMEFELLAGRNFSTEISADTIDYAIIVNEKALADLGQDISNVGNEFPLMEENDTLVMGTIVGVVKDFHFTSFKNEIKPFVFFYRADGHSNMTIKLSAIDLSASITELEKIWTKANPGIPFDYYFLDDSIAKLHLSEEKLSTILFDLTVLAIFIAFVGMFAMANLVIKDKIKEIAVRKVLGAEVKGLVLMITKNFMILVIIANMIAIPISYYIMKLWLNGFAYRIDLSLWIFIGSALITFIIAWASVGFQSYKAAKRRLVESLIYE